MVLVEPVMPPLALPEALLSVLPGVVVLLPLVPGPPMELVLSEVPLPEGAVLPAVLLDPVPLSAGGVVVLDELVEPVAPGPVVPASRSQAVSERAANMEKIAAAH